MTGKGRGRGGGLSFTHEQLQVLGVSRGDNTGPTLIPPPLFPKLEVKPLPLNYDAATDYMLIVKDQFIEYLHETPAYVKQNTPTDGIERYSDKYKQLTLDAKQGKTLNCVWVNMPSEIRPQANRIRIIRRKRKIDDANILTQKLQTLEKNETLDETGDIAENKDEDTVKNENENDNDDEEIEDEEEQEYEIDEGTDYANNYFDNGEDYDEEDDNLDDGPVY